MTHKRTRRTAREDAGSVIPSASSPPRTTPRHASRPSRHSSLRAGLRLNGLASFRGLNMRQCQRLHLRAGFSRLIALVSLVPSKARERGLSPGREGATPHLYAADCPHHLESRALGAVPMTQCVNSQPASANNPRYPNCWSTTATRKVGSAALSKMNPGPASPATSKTRVRSCARLGGKFATNPGP
ncbi:MAG: hypothetical protein KatS3mg059_1162 [Thermomicrobiales bacterium]|nr:MAG: hypothetical protein KatS3mg059_1162 [Thermomicrobiales bacterium]